MVRVWGTYLKSLVEGFLFGLNLAGSRAALEAGEKFFLKNLQMAEAPFGILREGKAYDLSLENGADFRFLSAAL